MSAQARSHGRQFEDDQNALELAPFLLLDGAVFYDFSEKISAGLRVEIYSMRKLKPANQATAWSRSALLAS